MCTDETTTYESPDDSSTDKGTESVAESLTKASWNRRTFLKAAALGTAAVALLSKSGGEVALAHTDTKSSCTANDIEVLGGQIINEPCGCTPGGKFPAVAQFTVINHNNARRKCITLHMGSGGLLGTRRKKVVPGARLAVLNGEYSRRRGGVDLTDSLKALLIETARTLKGSARRVFMARTVKELGPGGQRRAERALGWNRATIRKGARELASGVAIVDAFALRGRKRAEEHLPHLLADLRAIVDGQSQADPQFRTNRLYTRLSAAEVRRQLIAQKGYTDEELPTVQTIGAKLNALGYTLRAVAKTQPQKRSPRPTPSSPR